MTFTKNKLKALVTSYISPAKLNYRRDGRLEPCALLLSDNGNNIRIVKMANGAERQCKAAERRIKKEALKMKAVMIVKRDKGVSFGEPITILSNENRFTKDIWTAPSK